MQIHIGDPHFNVIIKVINSTYEVINILHEFPRHHGLKKKKKELKSAISISVQKKNLAKLFMWNTTTNLIDAINCANSCNWTKNRLKTLFFATGNTIVQQD